jgi:AraC-like DNA-binding protein
VIETLEYDFAGWSKVLADTHLSMRLFDPRCELFRARIRSKSVSGVRMFDIVMDAHGAERTPALLSADDTRVYGIELQIEGSSVIEQDGVRSVLGPGDYTLYDSTRPFNRYFDERVRIFVLRFPQNMISLPSHTMRSITAMRLGADEGIGVVVSPFMKNIADNMNELNGWAGTRVMHSLIDLVGAALAEKLFIEDAERGGARAQGFLRICDYIMDNLSDPSLSPDSIAAGTFISTRQLHKLFHAEQVTVSQWVRDRRLEACRRQLADPGDSRLSVSDIAASWGIFDAAHFSRIFKQAYGQSPREYRRDHKISA